MPPNVFVSLLIERHGMHLVAAVARTHPAVVRKWTLGQDEIDPDDIARLRTLRS